METAPGLARSALKPPRRRTAVIAVACWAGLLTTGFLLGDYTGQRARPERPAPVPIFVDAPSVPAPVVTVNVPPPPPPPAPPPAPEPPPAPAPRALAPHLEAACITPTEEVAPALAVCSWDDGLPAISTDGALLIKKSIGEIRPFGGSSLAIEFFDTSSSRRVRQVVLLSESDYDATGKPRPGIERRVEQRVAGLQRTLDARGFRSLIDLGSSDSGVE